MSADWQAKRLNWRPVLDDHPNLRNEKLLAGYTTDETWVCTIDARDPDGYSGIHADFQFGPKEDYHRHHISSVTEAKKWCQQAWGEMLGEWIATQNKHTVRSTCEFTTLGDNP